MTDSPTLQAILDQVYVPRVMGGAIVDHYVRPDEGLLYLRGRKYIGDHIDMMVRAVSLATLERVQFRIARDQVQSGIDLIHLNLKVIAEWMRSRRLTVSEALEAGERRRCR
jgi:hypothetical protein